MGMTVFSGMLIATILGVLLVPDALRAGREVDRRDAATPPAETPATVPAWEATDDDSTRLPPPRGAGLQPCRASRPAAGARAACRARAPWAPTTSDRSCSRRPSTAGRQPPSPESLADAGWWKVFDDAALFSLVREGVANNLDLRIASARVAEARELTGFAKSFRYPEVNLPARGTQASRPRVWGSLPCRRTRTPTGGITTGT